MRKIFVLSLLSFFLIDSVSAHCPLCTIGAGAAAAGAVWLGVSKVVVSLFIGAFAVSMGWWFSNIIKKQYVPYQKWALIIGSFLLTIIPLMPIFSAIGPLYIPFIGEYGTTFAFNYSLAGSVLGGVIVCCAPGASKGLTKLRKGKMLPFQGIVLTLVLLLIAGGIVQLLI
jgi:hypothetical protein